MAETEATGHDAHTSPETTSLTVTLPPQFVEAVAQRVAALLEQAQPTEPVSPWICGARAAADYLGCSEDRMKKLTAAGAIPHRKQAGRVFYRRDELDDWLDDHYQ